jgi:hypothetical protein
VCAPWTGGARWGAPNAIISSLVQQPKPPDAGADVDDGTESSQLQHYSERLIFLQVQCCGGGVRLRGSARGPPHVETQGLGPSWATSTALHPHMRRLVRSDKARATHNERAPKAPTSRSLLRVCARKRQHATSLQPHHKRSHHIDGRSSRGTHSTHSCSLADVCLSVGALACAVACWGGQCCHGVTSGRHVMPNMSEAPKDRGTALSLHLSDGPQLTAYHPCV